MIFAFIAGAVIFGLGIMVGAALVQTTISKIQQNDV